jgi:hypothetical protein
MANQRAVKSTDDTRALDIIEEKQQPTRELEATTLVNVMNNTHGLLIYKSEYTGKGFQLAGYGKMRKIQLQDLENLYSEQPTIIDQGWLVVLDNDVVDYLYLNDLYEGIITPKEVDKFLTLSEAEIIDRLDNAPRGMIESLALVIKQKISAGDKYFGQVSKIRFFEDILKVKFEV